MKQCNKTEILVLGGGYAGTLAVLRLSRNMRRDRVQITLVNASDHFVERIRFHQQATNQVVKQYAYTDLLKGTGVNFIKGWVTGLSSDQQMVAVHTARGDTQVAYDYLVYALGSKVDIQGIPGASEHAFSLSTAETAQALLLQLTKVTAQGGRLLICGGGLTGIEAATEFAESYPRLRVTLVTKGVFGDHLSQRGQQHLRHTFERLNIDVIDQKAVHSIQPDHAICDDEMTIPFDVCVWAGAFTVPTLARHVGLPVNERGQIIVDKYLRVKSMPNIYAIGDAATLQEAMPIAIRMACATAAPMGSYVGNHLAAVIDGRRQQTPYRFRYFLRCISLGRHDGLVQFVEADDTIKNRVVTGWLGAKLKELVCRSTIWNMQFERQLAVLFAGAPQHYIREVQVANQQTT